ncbi:putative membrane protein [Lactiplantibacillus pentosus KCA1]|nr:hypothetical protein [Lactiplantibacillus pentosus]EIW12958.1 putative membrane protein [Lactiplantibacillus pentosus KCA1]
MLALLIIFIIYHFIHEQFEFSRITRLNYWIIPIIMLFQFLRTFTWSITNGLMLAGILVFATVVGYFQASHTQLKIELAVPHHSDDEQSTTVVKIDPQQKTGTGQPPTNQATTVSAQGGRPYLIGWLLTLGAQLVIEWAYLHEELSWATVNNEFLKEVFADLSSIYRFSESGRHTSWTLWALTGATSLAYTLWLAHRSPAVRQAVFRTRMRHRN